MFGCQLVSRARQYEQTRFLGMKGCQSLVSMALEYQRFAPIQAENPKLFYLLEQSGFGCVACHVCILVKGYCQNARRKSSSGPLFEKKILGHRSINFKHTSVSVIIIFKNFGRCLKHLGKLCNEHSQFRIFQGIFVNK